MRTIYSSMSPCVRSIVDAVAATYGLHPTKIFRRTKLSRSSYARHVAIFVCRAELDMSLAEIGDEFGIKDPSVIYALEQVTRLVAACDVRALAGVIAGEKAAERWNGTGQAAE